MSKVVSIFAEELKAAGVEIAEEVLEKAVATIFEKALPRVVVEEENAMVKTVAGMLVTAYPAIKPVLDKATDLNKDGQ